ncbi:MAG TPA: orotate phosphoribosyltransferase [Clostridiales bacterium]|nr:orotate phosphoribosyltransferase [Clostridiales bacterium]
MSNKLVQWLFKTDALRVSSADKPFWYTSGTIGPYYINTHFLYGSEKKATELLEFINEAKEDICSFPLKLTELLWENYNKDAIFKGLIDHMCIFIKNNININEVDYISGGERRDWFFSFLVAQLLEKPHLTIYKDLSINEFYKNKVNTITDLQNKNVLHIADLVTEASSYERAWIPAINRINGIIKWSVVVVDRKQGGKELLARMGVNLYPMVCIDRGTFDNALNMGLIDEKQYNMIIDFINDPKGSMKRFLIGNPDFLENALTSGGKDAERAKLCIEKNIYGLEKGA